MNKITPSALILCKLARNCERELSLGDFDRERQPNFSNSASALSSHNPISIDASRWRSNGRLSSRCRRATRALLSIQPWERSPSNSDFPDREIFFRCRPKHTGCKKNYCTYLCVDLRWGCKGAVFPAQTKRQLASAIVRRNVPGRCRSSPLTPRANRARAVRESLYCP